MIYMLSKMGVLLLPQRRSMLFRSKKSRPTNRDIPGESTTEHSKSSGWSAMTIGMVILVLLVFGSLIVLTSGSAIAPFIYTVF